MLLIIAGTAVQLSTKVAEVAGGAGLILVIGVPLLAARHIGGSPHDERFSGGFGGGPPSRGHHGGGGRC
jgi:hypothetical protein